LPFFAAYDGTHYDGTACAPYLTPAWDTYACMVYCKPGFISRGGVCKACSDVCPLGFTCPGVIGGLPVFDCVACSSLLHLPGHAEWMDFECTWACSPGYYLREADNVCLACPSGQQCFDPSQRYMGCFGSSPGQCLDVTVTCQAGISYLAYEVYSASGVCLPCTQSEPNATFVSVVCTAISDAVLRPCTSPCPPQHFAVQGCNATADTQCRPCSPPPSPQGLRLVQPCGGSRDAVYGLCSAGMSCDPSSQDEVPCAAPRLAKNGICVCPPATEGALCLPIRCRQGWYPNASIDNCSSCGDDQRMQTVPNVMGVDACACPGGYFAQRFADHIVCWPCGDLMCTPGLQQQTPQVCSGQEAFEPSCQCRVPHGAVVLDETLCTFACDETYYDQAAQANMTPALWPQRFVDREPVPMAFFAATEVTELALVGPSTVATVVNGVDLWIHHLGSPSLHVNNTLFIQGDRLALVSMTLCKDAVEHQFWVGLLYETQYCAYTEALDLCSTVELVLLSPCGGGTGLCPSLLYNWGKDMQAGFHTGRILRMTLMDQTLYMLLSTHQVYAYHVYYHTLTSSPSTWMDDPIYNITGPLPPSTLLVGVGGTLYAPGFSMGPAAHLFTPPLSTTFLGAAGDHILLVGPRLQVDIWNGFQAGLEDPWSQNWVWGYNAWASFNGTHVALAQQPLLPPLDTTVTGEPMQCLRLRGACGFASIRIPGTTLCVCIAGYYKTDGLVCSICPANYYCSGKDDAPVACTPHASSKVGSSDVSQCACIPGFYPFQATCIACPPGYWCYGGAVLPIQCMPLSTTYGPASTTPLDCYCLDRTHGLTCQPCDISEYCNLLPAASQPTWVALEIRGWGLKAKALCLSSFIIMVYDGIPGPLPRVNAWAAIVVVDDEQNYIKNLTDCLLSPQADFVFESNISVYTRARAASGVRDHVPCPMNWEWSATNTLGGYCICIEGYHTATYNGYAVCIPCMNGTMRERYSPDQCVACTANNTHAPWMGMGHCVCMDGFFLDPDTGECVFVGHGFPLYAWVTSAPLMIPLSLACGTVSLLLCIASALLCYS